MTAGGFLVPERFRQAMRLSFFEMTNGVTILQTFTTSDGRKWRGFDCSCGNRHRLGSRLAIRHLTRAVPA